ncbi:MAG: GNA1162 family protein [Planctomycetota bacterium]
MMRSALCAAALALLAACESPGVEIREEFIQSAPRSILVLPPLNESIEPIATYGALASTTFPLAENGFYVFPVAVVDGMLRENGLPTPFEMHQVSLEKLREVFDCDAVLYLTVSQWGTQYIVVDSQTQVAIRGELVDAVTGATLWVGQDQVTTSSNSGGGDIITMLVGSVINQIATSVEDPSKAVAAQVNNELLRGPKRGWPYGPYHPEYDAQLAEMQAVASNAP